MTNKISESHGTRAVVLTSRSAASRIFGLVICICTSGSDNSGSTGSRGLLSQLTFARAAQVLALDLAARRRRVKQHPAATTATSSQRCGVRRRESSVSGIGGPAQLSSAPLRAARAAR